MCTLWTDWSRVTLSALQHYFSYCPMCRLLFLAVRPKLICVLWVKAACKAKRTNVHKWADRLLELALFTVLNDLLLHASLDLGLATPMVLCLVRYQCGFRKICSHIAICVLVSFDFQKKNWLGFHDKGQNFVKIEWLLLDMCLLHTKRSTALVKRIEKRCNTMD